eukprot:3189003-Pyramimonas_sp.AAC.1
MRPRAMQRKAAHTNGAETAARIGLNLDMALSRKAFRSAATRMATPRRTRPLRERDIHVQPFLLGA